MKNDLIKRSDAIDVIRFLQVFLGGESIFHPEVKKSVIGCLEELPASRAIPCKFCDDLDVLNQVVCYLPRENGTDTPVPINFCPYCGREIMW